MASRLRGGVYRHSYREIWTLQVCCGSELFLCLYMFSTRLRVFLAPIPAFHHVYKLERGVRLPVLSCLYMADGVLLDMVIRGYESNYDSPQRRSARLHPAAPKLHTHTVSAAP